MQVKVIADPAMHSMPTAAMHPSGKYVIYQSLDSHVVTYGCVGKVRQNKKKTFSGHMVGGTACEVRFKAPLFCQSCLVVGAARCNECALMSQRAICAVNSCDVYNPMRAAAAAPMLQLSQEAAIARSGLLAWPVRTQPLLQLAATFVSSF